jgi:hypothetical protein
MRLGAGEVFEGFEVLINGVEEGERVCVKYSDHTLHIHSGASFGRDILE